ncbi:MAG: hypothetical protein ACLSHU_12440 [Oscillospiraceae bacterium]
MILLSRRGKNTTFLRREGNHYGYHAAIAGLQGRICRFAKVSDSLYIGAFVIFGDQELGGSRGSSQKKTPPYGYLITAVGHLVTKWPSRTETKYMLAQKGPKLYMTGVFGPVAVTPSPPQGHTCAWIPPDAPPSWPVAHPHCGRCHLHRESCHALETLVEKADGNIVDTWPSVSDAQNREDILYLEKLPLSSTDGTVME